MIYIYCCVSLISPYTDCAESKTAPEGCCLDQALCFPIRQLCCVLSDCNPAIFNTKFDFYSKYPKSFPRQVSRYRVYRYFSRISWQTIKFARQ